MALCIALILYQGGVEYITRHRSIYFRRTPWAGKAARRKPF